MCLPNANFSLRSAVTTVQRQFPLLILTLLVTSNLSGAEDDSTHWAFKPVRRPVPPAVSNRTIVQTPIDSFMLSKLEPRGLAFAPKAGSTQLLRRMKLGLVGLLPTRGEIAQLLSDERPNAIDACSERLLCSPGYGETWARHWLDLVRYADTAGFNADPTRPLAYKYRDYVINAWNRNTSYDRFTAEQLAGDELFPESRDALIATGFNLMWPDESNASNVLLARQDALNDLTANFGSVFLGLTLGCAQCHDHKFDPILQRDFYQLQAFFAGIFPSERGVVGSPSALKSWRSKQKQWLAQTEPVRSRIHQLERDAKAKVGRIKRLKFPAVVLEAIDTAEEDRTAFQHQLAFWSERQIVVTDEQVRKALTDTERAEYEQLLEQLKRLESKRPSPPDEVRSWVVREIPNALPPTHLLAGGSYNKPQQQVSPEFPSFIKGISVASRRSPTAGSGSGRRSRLANWLASAQNPLTSRVIVNRIWQGHFGRGLAPNGNDFGTQSQPPVHAELLDWLAAELVDSGWDIKHIHRLILRSAVYQQSGLDDPAFAHAADPDNAYYSHFPRHRMAAEAVRDSLLQLSGQLSRKMYGPGVRPKLPPHYSAREAWKVSEKKADRVRRSVYIFAKRNLPYPLLDVLDFPDMHESCSRRARTTTPPQALTFLNSGLVLDLAGRFADRLIGQLPNGTPRDYTVRAFLDAYARAPTPQETELACEFLESQQTLIEAENPAVASDGFRAALHDLCHALLNSNEFLYID